jgi:hypothetical protein
MFNRMSNGLSNEIFISDDLFDNFNLILKRCDSQFFYDSNRLGAKVLGSVVLDENQIVKIGSLLLMLKNNVHLMHDDVLFIDSFLDSLSKVLDVVENIVIERND